MKAFIFGGGAQGRVILDILRESGKYKDIAFIDDDPSLAGKEIGAFRVEGDFAYAVRCETGSFRIIIALGAPLSRLAIADKAAEEGMAFLNAVHPSAVIMPSAKVGFGVMMGAQSVINSNAKIANHVIINTGAVIEHDAVVEDGATICSGVQLGGRTKVSRAAFIGTGAIILPRVEIGESSVIAAGSVVTKNVPDRTIVKGIPAVVSGEVDDKFDWKKLL